MPEVMRDADRFSGRTEATFVTIAEDTIEARDAFPEALRVIFTSGENDFSLAVPVKDPQKRMKPFLKDPSVEWTGELRDFIEENFEKEPIPVSVYNGFVQARLAPEGVHLFKLTRLSKFTRRSDGMDRVGFTVQTEEGYEAGWTVPYRVEVKIAEVPKEDGIRMLGTAWDYLENLGLDPFAWDEMLENSKALWPPHQGAFFADADNIMPEVMREITPSTVKIRIVNSEQYGLGPQRTGQYNEVKMAKVESAPVVNEEFDKEAALFAELWGNLAKLVMGRDDAGFYDGDEESEDGKYLIMNAIVPIVREYPKMVKRTHPNGNPAIYIPPTSADWEIDALVCLNLMAEKLITEHGTNLADLAGVIDAKDDSKIVEFVKTAVPEFAETFGEAY